MEREQRTPPATTDKPMSGLTDDKPPIEQPGPIIIKDGGSVEIDSPIFIFKENPVKPGRHYICDKKGKITSIIIMDGALELPEIKPKNGHTEIIVTFTPIP